MSNTHEQTIRQFLETGDIPGLMAYRQSLHGGLRMEMPEGEPAGDTGSPAGDEPADSSKTFTQADVDRIAGERAQRERAKFADYDDLKAKATEADTIRQQYEDLQGRYKADREAVAWQTELSKYDSILTADEVKVFLKDGYTVNDDGEVEGLDEALKTFFEGKPHFLKASAEGEQKEEQKQEKKKGVGSVDGGSKPPAAYLTQAQVEALSQEEYEEKRELILKSMPHWK